MFLQYFQFQERRQRRDKKNYEDNWQTNHLIQKVEDEDLLDFTNGLKLTRMKVQPSMFKI